MQRNADEPGTSLADVAAESPEESTQAEREVVGEDEPDIGDTVSPDQSQAAHDE